MKKIFLLLLCRVPFLLTAQTFEREMNTIPVQMDNEQLIIPFNGGFNSLGIAVSDIDNDGDPDLLLTGNNNEKLLFYRNDGNAGTGEFTLADYDLSGLNIGTGDNRIAFEDIDYDNDPDLFVGSNNGQLKYYENTGSPSDPSFELVNDFFDSIDIGYASSPVFYDLNGDGLNDLVSGSYREGLFYFMRENSTSLSFVFSDTLSDHLGELIKPGLQFHFPVFVDIDDDGDGDLFVGSNNTMPTFYRNTGTAASPEFTLENTGDIPMPSYNISGIVPAFADLDNDADFDMLIAGNEGFVSYYQNTGDAENPVFSLLSDKLKLGFLDFGYYSFPTMEDIDDDGDRDLFISNSEGDLHFFENTGSLTSPEFTWQTRSFTGFNTGGQNHAWGDLDGDSDLDLVVRNIAGPLYYYENIGTPAAPSFDSTGYLTDMAAAHISGKTADLADLDGDGDLDLFLMVTGPDYYGSIIVVRNQGSVSLPEFAVSEDTLIDNTGDVIRHYDPYFKFTDLDTDGDQDLFVGAYEGNLIFYENTGTINEPVFNFITEYFAGIPGGYNQSILVSLTDIDGDTDTDIISGRYMGGLNFYRNTSFISQPEYLNEIKSYTDLQNYPNPFSEITTIEYSLQSDSYVELSVFDLSGKMIYQLEKGYKSAGLHQSGINGNVLPSGVYYYRLKSDGLTETRKFAISH